MSAVARAASALRRFFGALRWRIDEISRTWDQRVLGRLTLQVGDDPPIPIPSPDMVWRPREGCFVWRHRLTHPEVVSEFRVHRAGRCLVRLQPRCPVFLLPDDELIVRVPGVIHPFGTFTAFPDRSEIDLPDRPADAFRLACLGCAREFPVIEMWVSRRFEGKAYCDACYYAHFRTERRGAPRNPGGD